MQFVRAREKARKSANAKGRIQAECLVHIAGAGSPEHTDGMA